MRLWKQYSDSWFDYNPDLMIQRSGLLPNSGCWLKKWSNHDTQARIISWTLELETKQRPVHQTRQCKNRRYTSWFPHVEWRTQLPEAVNMPSMHPSTISPCCQLPVANYNLKMLNGRLQKQFLSFRQHAFVRTLCPTWKRTLPPTSTMHVLPIHWSLTLLNVTMLFL